MAKKSPLAPEVASPAPTPHGVPTRYVLVGTFGETPPILTEAFFYYRRRHNPPILFSEVHVLTTTKGKAAAMAKLLGRSPGSNWWSKLLQELRIPPTKVSFDENHIHVLKDAQGNELDDVRTSEESLLVADQICEIVRGLCSRDDTAVYATMAGGRKTMGVYLTIALQLYARPQDRLFHVLIDPRIEALAKLASATQKVRARSSHRAPSPPPSLEFYYPRESIRIEGEKIHPDDIRIDCDEIPVLYWPWPSQKLRGQPGNFRELYERRQWELNALYDPPGLTIDGKQLTVQIGDQPVHLTRLEFLYYYFFAELRYAGPPGTIPLIELAELWQQIGATYPTIPKPSCNNPLLKPLQRFEQLFNAICPPTRGREVTFQKRLNTDLGQKPEEDYTVPVLSTFARIRKKVASVIPHMADTYAIRKDKEYGHPFYGIWLEPAKIEIRNPIP
jgi:CRISPR-associated protein (TIGR02584 family)